MDAPRGNACSVWLICRGVKTKLGNYSQNNVRAENEMIAIYNKVLMYPENYLVRIVWCCHFCAAMESMWGHFNSKSINNYSQYRVYFIFLVKYFAVKQAPLHMTQPHQSGSWQESEWHMWIWLKMHYIHHSLHCNSSLLFLLIKQYVILALIPFLCK